MSNDATININLQKELFAQLKQLRDDLSGVKSNVDKLEQSTKGSFAKIASSVKQISFVQITQGLQNLNNAFQNINAPGLQYGSTLAELSAITGVAGKDLDALGKKARASAKEFGGTAAESLNTYKVILSKLGPDIAKNQDALDAMEKNVRVLSKTMGGDTVAAVESLTTSMLQYGVDLSDPMKAQQEMAKMMNVMAAGAQEGSAEVNQVSAAINVAGVAMKQAKVSFEEGNAAIQALSKGGKDGAEGGVALRNILGKIAGEDIIPKAAADKLHKLGVNMDIVSNTALPLTTRLKELKKAQADATVISQVFGIENAAAANILLDSIDYQQDLTDKITGTNTAYEQAEIIMSSREESIKRMNAGIEDAKIAFFEATNGATAYLQPLAELGMTFSAFMPLISGMKKGYDALKKSQIAQTAAQKVLNVVSKIFNAIMKANPIFLIIGGVIALTGAVYGLSKAFKAQNAVEKTSAELKSRVAEKTADQRAEIEVLFLKLKTAKVGTEAYNQALKELDTLLPGIVDKYNLQAGALANINAAHTSAIKLIEERATAEAAQEMLKEKMVGIIEKKKEIADRNEYHANVYKTAEGLKNAKDSDYTLQALSDELVALENEKNAILNVIDPSANLSTKQNVVALGLKKSIDDLNADQSSFKLGIQAGIKSPATVDAAPPITALNVSSTSPEDKNYSDKSSQFKNITVNIDKLVESLNISSTSIKEGANQIKQQITEALIGAVRDFEVAM